MRCHTSVVFLRSLISCRTHRNAFVLVHLLCVCTQLLGTTVSIYNVNVGPLYTSFQTCRIIFSVDPWDQKNKSALADLVLILQAQRDGDWQDPQAAGGARGAVAEGARHVQDRGAAQQHQDVRRHEETGDSPSLSLHACVII